MRVKDPEESDNLMLQRYLGIWDCYPTPLDRVADERGLSELEVRDRLEKYRSIKVGGRVAADFDLPSTPDELSESDESTLTELYADRNEILSTLSFLTQGIPKKVWRTVPTVGSSSSQDSPVLIEARPSLPRISRHAPATKRYVEWNSAIAKALTNAGEFAYLGIVDEDPQSVMHGFATAEAARANLLSAVIENLGEDAELFAPFVYRVRQWDLARQETYPALGLLATLCVAAGMMRNTENHWSTAYYAPLSEALGLGEVDPGQLGNWYRAVADVLWDGFDDWMESVGLRPSSPYAGNHRYVGKPIAQVVFASSDRIRVRSFIRSRMNRYSTSYDTEDMFDEFKIWVSGASLTDSCRALLKSLSQKQKDSALRAVFDTELARTSESTNPMSPLGPEAVKISLAFAYNSIERTLDGFLVVEGEIAPHGLSLHAVMSDGTVSEFQGNLVQGYGLKDGQFLFTSPNEDLGASILGSTEIRLVDTDTGTTIGDHYVDDLIVLNHDSSTNWFIESRTIEVGSHILIVLDPEVQPEVHEFATASEEFLPMKADNLAIGFEVFSWQSPAENSVDLPVELAQLIRNPGTAGSITFSGAPRVPHSKKSWLTTVRPSIHATVTGEAWIEVSGPDGFQRKEHFIDSRTELLGEFSDRSGSYKARLITRDNEVLARSRFELVDPEPSVGTDGPAPLLSNSEKIFDSAKVTAPVRITRSSLHAHVGDHSPPLLDPAVYGRSLNTREDEHIGSLGDPCNVCGHVGAKSDYMPERAADGRGLVAELLAGTNREDTRWHRDALVKCGLPSRSTWGLLANSMSAGFSDFYSDIGSWRSTRIFRTRPTLVINHREHMCLIGSILPESLRRIEQNIDDSGIGMLRTTVEGTRREWPDQVVVDKGANSEQVQSIVESVLEVPVQLVEFDATRLLETDPPATWYLENLEWHPEDGAARLGRRIPGQGNFANFTIREINGNWLIHDGERQAVLEKSQTRFFHQLITRDTLIRNWFEAPQPLIIPRWMRLPGLLERMLYLEAGGPPSYDGAFRYYRRIQRSTAVRLEELLKG